MNLLGASLRENKKAAEAINIFEEQIAMGRRVGMDENLLLAISAEIASCHYDLDDDVKAIKIEREIYKRRLALNGASLRRNQTSRSAATAGDEIFPLR